MLRQYTAGCAAALLGGLLSPTLASPTLASPILTSQATPALLAQATGSTCGQTTGNTIIYDQPRRDSPVVAQIVQPGRQLSLDPNFSAPDSPAGNWVRVTTPSVAGFTLSQYLNDCGSSAPAGSTTRPAEPTGRAEVSRPPADGSEGIVGSCAIALADRSAPQLGVRTEAGAEAAYNAIAAGNSLILSARPAFYSPEQGRYWRQVLAYPPVQANRSRTSEAWISETGPNTPRLLHNSAGVLVTRQGQAYADLNIARRPCQTLFPNANITEGQALPQALPNGYRRH